MSVFDTILLVALSGFVFYGFFFGLIRTIGSIVGILAGFFVASNYYLAVFSWGSNLSFGYDKIGKIVCFLLLFSLVNRLIGFAFALLDSALGIVSIIPFVKTINRIAGAVLGLAEGALVLGIIFYYINNISIASKFMSQFTAGSKIIPSLASFSEMILPFLPSLVEKIKFFV